MSICCAVAEVSSDLPIRVAAAVVEAAEAVAAACLDGHLSLLWALLLLWLSWRIRDVHTGLATLLRNKTKTACFVDGEHHTTVRHHAGWETTGRLEAFKNR